MRFKVFHSAWMVRAFFSSAIRTNFNAGPLSWPEVFRQTAAVAMKA